MAEQEGAATHHQDVPRVLGRHLERAADHGTSIQESLALRHEAVSLGEQPALRLA